MKHNREFWRQNKEIRQRALVVGIFPNDAAIMLVGTPLLEQTDECK